MKVMKIPVRFGLAVVCCLSFINSLTQPESPARPLTYSIPQPSGRYSIGTTIFYAVDSSRFDSVFTQQGRDINFQVWYPTAVKQKTSPYITTELYKAMDEENYNDVDSLTLLQWGKLQTHVSFQVPVVKKKFPLVFFLHGFGMSRYSYTTIIEDLVSHGVIVISLDSPHSGLTVLPGGKAITTLYDGKPVAKCENMAEDVRFVYHWLEGSDRRQLSALKPYMDFSRAAVVGHSLGGAAALETCRTDDRFLACIDLDGDPFGKVEEAGLTKPTLVLLNQPLVKDEDFTDSSAKEKWKAMGNERKGMWENIFNKKPDVPAYAFRLLATNHFTFTDFPFVTTQYYKQAKPGRTMDKKRSLTIISAYVRTFLDRYLNENTAARVKELPQKFPETNLHVTTVD